jgi:mRNA interferase MazF
VNLKRGEIYLVDLKPLHGYEMTKNRPAVIVSNDIINEHASVIVVCPITDSYGKDSPFHILINKGEANMKKDSVVHCAQIRAIDKDSIIKKLGILSKEKLEKVEKGICIVLDVIKIS